MIRDVLGRDLSRDLDRHITGNYGEDQLLRGGRTMGARREYIPQGHPAVGAVACSYCRQPKGTPCRNGRLAVVPQGRSTHGTHMARVKEYQKQIPIEANPTGPLKPVTV